MSRKDRRATTPPAAPSGASAPSSRPPPSEPEPSRRGRLRLAVAALFPVAAVGLVAAWAELSPSVPFLVRDGKAQWITYPVALSLRAEWAKPEGYPPTVFTKRFLLRERPRAAWARWRSVGEARIFVNGAPANPGKPGRWKREERADVSASLRAGSNEVRAEVRNRLGPCVLHLHLEGPAAAVGTGAGWEVSIGSSPPVAAVVAEDTRPFPESLEGPAPPRLARQKSAELAGLFLLSCAAVLLGGRLPGAAHRLPAAATAFLCAVWIFLFFRKWLEIPMAMGFDSAGHLDYVNFLLAHRRIPFATEGWKMDQPPFFYLLEAALALSLKPLLMGQASFTALVLKTVPFLSCLGHIWVAACLARALFPAEPMKIFWAAAAAGTLPMNLYMSAYYSNEPLQSFLSDLSILIAVRLVLAAKGEPGEAPRGGRPSGRAAAPAPEWLGYARLGAVAGLALLTRITAVLIAPPILLILGWKLLAVDKVPWGRAAGLIGAAVFSYAAVSGWYFARGLLHFGAPVLANFGQIPGGELTQQPGYHTLRYFLTFGSSLRHPFFASFHSFWDGVFSTFWGDGCLGGTDSLHRVLPPWNLGFMSIAYLLGLPATLLMIAGYLRLILRAALEANASLRLAAALVALEPFVVGLAMLALALAHPWYGFLKAYYALLCVGPISLFAAEGIDAVDRLLASPSLRWVRVAFFGWLGTLAAVVFLSFGA